MRSLAPLGMSGNCFCSSRSVSKRHARASTALPDVSPPKRYTYSPVGSMVVAKSDTRSGTPPGRGVQEPLARCSAGPAMSASVLSHTRSSEEMREASVLRHASAPTRALGAASSAALSVALRESWTSRPHSADGPSAARAPPSCLPARSSPLLPPARCEVRGARCEVRGARCEVRGASSDLRRPAPRAASAHPANSSPAHVHRTATCPHPTLASATRARSPLGERRARCRVRARTRGIPRATLLISHSIPLPGKGSKSVECLCRISGLPMRALLGVGAGLLGLSCSLDRDRCRAQTPNRPIPRPARPS